MKKLAITTFILGALAMGFSAQPAQAQVSVSVTIGGSTTSLPLTAGGSTAPTAGAGCPGTSPTTGSHIPTADGSTRNTGGPGCPVTHGEAAHTTTGHGKPRVRLVLGARNRLGSRVGDVELQRPLCRLGAAAAERRPGRVRLRRQRSRRDPDAVRVRAHESFCGYGRHFSSCFGAGKRDDIPADETLHADLGFRAGSSGIPAFRWRQFSARRAPGSRRAASAPPIPRRAR